MTKAIEFGLQLATSLSRNSNNTAHISMSQALSTDSLAGDNEIKIIQTILTLEEALEQETKLYESSDKPNSYPFALWYDAQKWLPLMTRFATSISCILVMSVPSESFFSNVVFQITDRRNRLIPKKAERIMLIYENLLPRPFSGG